ncbi:alpha-mannosidase 2-like [Pollicipes pollicipes]|uniref:alpha-mannosidase 2-like n=1 Tax=Pollicipes pollicipes TaxID=41117 RepID=UPI0018855071|nr:alpha-mannosidase 2-like [Pollicipes pollicipes]
MDLSRATIMCFASLLLELGLQDKVVELFAQYSPLQRGLGMPPQLVKFSVEPGSRRRLFLYNPLAQERTEHVQFLVTEPNIAVEDASGQRLLVQLEPQGKAFLAHFLVRLLPLSIHVFSVIGVRSEGEVAPPAAIARTDADLGDAFTISNARFQLSFNKTGFLWSVRDRRVNRELPLAISFGAFATVERESGLYLFAAKDQPPRRLPCAGRRWAVREDAVSSEASVDCGRVRLTVRLLHTDAPPGQAVHLETETRLSRDDDETDVFMHLRTGVASCAARGCGFFADANDYQMVWRPYVPAAGVAGNVYPVTTQASLQDHRLRLSLLMDHSRGVASLKEGTLTAMLDRRSRFDDDRGIGQGNQANRPVRASFLVTFEHLPEPPASDELFANGPLTRRSPASQLNHPPQLLDGALPCDWELVTLRQLPERHRYEYPGRRLQLTLLRRRLRCRPAATPGVEFSPFISLESVEPVGLTGGERPAPAEPLRGLRDLRLEPDELRTFELSYRRPGLDSVEEMDEEEVHFVKELNGVGSKEAVR